ncbi:MAG: glycosyltransferase, partial [Patescibacteria group bacterium]
MRVLIVSPAYTSSRRGGAEVVAARTAAGFHALGWEVTILAAGEGKETVREGVLCRLQPWNFCDLESVRLLPVLLRYAWAVWDATGFGARTQLKKILEANKFDLIVVHGLRGLGYGLLPALTKAAKVVYVAHDVQLLEPSGILYPTTADAALGGVSRRVYRWYMRKLSSYVSTAVFPSNFLKDFYSKYGYFTKANCAVVPNPFGEGQKKDVGEAMTVVFDGQLEKQKGIYVLLEAWSQLAKLDATLLIMGEGSALATVRTAAFK